MGKLCNAFILIFVLSACAGKLSLKKRKYCKGIYFEFCRAKFEKDNLAGLKKHKRIKCKTINPYQEVTSEILMEASPIIVTTPIGDKVCIKRMGHRTTSQLSNDQKTKINVPSLDEKIIIKPKAEGGDYKGYLKFALIVAISIVIIGGIWFLLFPNLIEFGALVTLVFLVIIVLSIYGFVKYIM